MEKSEPSWSGQSPIDKKRRLPCKASHPGSRLGAAALLLLLLCIQGVSSFHVGSPLVETTIRRGYYIRPPVRTLALPTVRPVQAAPKPTALQRMINYPANKLRGVVDFFRRELPMVRFLWPETIKLKACLVFSMVFLVLDKWFSLRVPFILQRAIDALSSDSKASAPAQSVVRSLLLYGAMRMLSVICTETKTTLFTHVSQDVLQRFSAQIFRHLHSLDASFHLNTPSGVISVAYSRAVRGFQTMLFQLVFSVIPVALELALVSRALWKSFGAVFAAIAVLTFSAYLVFTVVVTQHRLGLRQEMVRVDNERNGFFIDSLLNHEVVKLFASEEREARRYDGYLSQLRRANIASTLAIAYLNIGQAVLFGMGLVGSLLLALQRVRAGTMSVGDLVAVNALLLQVAVPFDYIGFTYQEIRQSFVDMGYMRHVLAANQPAVRDEPHARSLNDLAPRTGPSAVELRNVTFAYNVNGEHEAVLRGVSLSIPPGESVALVGSSGSGKSTLLKMITRMLDPTSGTVCVDGVDVRDVTLRSLRNRIAVVPQDTCLFDASIEHNVRYGNEQASAEEVEHAVDLSNLRGTIRKLADGMQTRVGERGNRLSGGERQKVSIARAILRDPSLILCDEVTSSVDAFAERDIMQCLRSAAAKRTTIIVAHRLASIVHCDRIFVLDRGTIVESGTHAELLKNETGVYHNMWRTQHFLASAGEGDLAPGAAHGFEAEEQYLSMEEEPVEEQIESRPSWLHDPQVDEDPVMLAEGYLPENEEDSRVAEENAYLDYMRSSLRRRRSPREIARLSSRVSSPTTPPQPPR